MIEFLSEYQCRGIKIARVNSIRVAKPLIFTLDMFELVVNRLFAYADDSTLLAVVRQPANGPAVAA